MFEPITVFLCLKLMFHDVDYDGRHNYLVVQPMGAGQREWMVAFDTAEDINWQDGCYEMEGECDTKTMALDPPNKVDEGLGSFGYPRLAPICNAHRIEGKHFKWQESTRSSSSPKAPASPQ